MAMKSGGGAAFGGSAVPSVAGADQEVNADINVTPMIDVMLVLLIIFMVITPSLAGYTVTLPKAQTAEEEKDDRVTLGIDNRGIYYLDEDGVPLTAEQLTSQLITKYSVRPEDHVLYMKADQGIEYSVVLTAIDAARKAGVRRIGAITELPQDADSQE